jgi:hypothetical protein
VSGLAHYFEDEGLATVIISLVRKHTILIRPPRALWVPFELGRPFGSPGDADTQRRVLQAALALLDKTAAEPLLEDFTEPVPGDANDDWRFPGTLDDSSVSAEIASIVPIWQSACERLGRTSVGISGLDPVTAMDYVERFHSAEPMPNPKGMGRIPRARFSIDDIKAVYLEAAMAAGGRPGTHQLHEWFWSGTLAGALLREFQELARTSPDKNLAMIAGSLVPAERTHCFLNGLEEPG